MSKAKQLNVNESVSTLKKFYRFYPFYHFYPINQ